MNASKLSLSIISLVLLVAAFALGYLLGGVQRDMQARPSDAMTSKESAIELLNRQLAEKNSELQVARNRLKQVSDKERFLSLCVAYSGAINSYEIENDTPTKALIDCVNELAEKEVLTVRGDGGRPITWTETVDDQSPKVRTGTGPSVEFKDGSVFELLVGQVIDGKAYVIGGTGHLGYTTPYPWQP